MSDYEFREMGLAWHTVVVAPAIADAQRSNRSGDPCVRSQEWLQR